MTASNYKPSLSLVLAHEGGFVNHPKDPGGPTNNGITQAVYDAYRKLKGLQPLSVKFISPIEVAEIYDKQYWRLVQGNDLPAGVDYAVFDFAVNSGVSRAIRYLQKAVGVNDDGVIGNVTINAVIAKAKENEEALIATYCANRLAFLKALKTFDTFGVGWTRRVIGNMAGVQAGDTGVLDYATMMARNDPVYAMPTQIGALADEIPAKAIAPVEMSEFYPMAGPKDLAAIAAANDTLAMKIALSNVAA